MRARAFQNRHKVQTSCYHHLPTMTDIPLLTTWYSSKSLQVPDPNHAAARSQRLGRSAATQTLRLSTVARETRNPKPERQPRHASRSSAQPATYYSPCHAPMLSVGIISSSWPNGKNTFVVRVEIVYGSRPRRNWSPGCSAAVTELQ